MKWPNTPKFQFKRANIERALIGCSAMLVLLLSVQSRDVNLEPYEEPLEAIEQSQAEGFDKQWQEWTDWNEQYGN